MDNEGWEFYLKAMRDQVEVSDRDMGRAHKNADDLLLSMLAGLTSEKDKVRLYAVLAEYSKIERHFG